MNAGLHVINPEVLELVGINADSVGKVGVDGKPVKVDLDRQLLKPLAGTGKMFCYDSPEYVKDMGTPERYYSVCKDCKEGRISAKNLKNKQKAIFLPVEVVTLIHTMIAVVVLTLLMIMPIGIRKILSSNYALIAAAVIINILNFGTAQLMNNVYVQYFIHDVLGKPSTLSGRAQIWAIIFGFIRKKLFLGYGYYNGRIETYLGYGNPQNGVLKILLDTGIIGLLLYSILVFVALRPLNGKNFALNFPIIAFLYAMIVASLVEINLTHMIVFMALAIVAFGCERKEINS